MVGQVGRRGNIVPNPAALASGKDIAAVRIRLPHCMATRALETPWISICVMGAIVEIFQLPVRKHL